MHEWEIITPPELGLGNEKRRESGALLNEVVGFFGRFFFFFYMLV